MKKLDLKLNYVGTNVEIDRNKMAIALKTWRIRSGYTQRQAAAYLGTSRYTLIRAENGRPIGWQTAYKVYYLLSLQLQGEQWNNELSLRNLPKP